jgi:hypothetical protein
LKYEIIWKILKKGKLNSEKIRKILKERGKTYGKYGRKAS